MGLHVRPFVIRHRAGSIDLSGNARKEGFGAAAADWAYLTRRYVLSERRATRRTMTRPRASSVT